MTAKIHELKTSVVVTNERTIEILEDYLKQAKNGEIIEIAVAALEPDGTSSTMASKTEHLQALLGAVEILKHRMLRLYMDDYE